MIKPRMTGYQRPGWIYGGGPAERDGRVYIAADRGRETSPASLYDVRASSGKSLWQANIGNDVESAPSVDVKNVYIGVADNEVFAFNSKQRPPALDPAA